MSLHDAEGRPYEPATELAIRAWRRDHPGAARVLDELLHCAGRDTRGHVVGTVDDHMRAVASAHAAAGVCHACAYDLDSLEADHERCLTCPECGHIWRLSNELVGRRNRGVEHMERATFFGAAIVNPVVLLWRFLWPLAGDSQTRDSRRDEANP